MFEAKAATVGSFSAANQIAGSLSYALGRLHQLRSEAKAGNATESLYLFGAVSSGPLWQICVAYEIDPATDVEEMECVSTCPFFNNEIVLLI